MIGEACNACGVLCDDDQFNREGMGYCAECFAQTRPADTGTATTSPRAGLLDKVDVRGILEQCGADPQAPEGCRAWSLAQVAGAVAELIAADLEVDESERALWNSGRSNAATRVAAFDRKCMAKHRRDLALARVGASV